MSGSQPLSLTDSVVSHPLSAVVPTINRPRILQRTLESLAAQSVVPRELIIIDASSDEQTQAVANEWREKCAPSCLVIWQRAVQAGAAAQRNQGVALTTQPFIWFFDDDIVFEPDCVQNLWHAIESDEMLGGVNAMITNQRYSKPGKVSRTLFRLLHGKSEASYAGKCIGPALNLLPEDDSVLPEVVPVEWLNTTCTIYRKSALRIPPFSEHFTGYSLLEDLALSLTIGRNWKLANARTARIFHDSQPGVHKDNPTRIAEMALVNRHYVMNHVLHRNSLTDHVKLGLLEAFGVVTSLVAPGSWKTLPFVLIGKARGFWSILTQRQALSDDLAPRPSEAVALKSE